MSFTQVPTGFIPEQDKGYLLVNVQLPDAASVQRTQEVMAHGRARSPETPGVAHTVGIAGQSLLLGANASELRLDVRHARRVRPAARAAS